MIRSLTERYLFTSQFICLMIATTVVAGGGQFPGNKASSLVYLKLILFLIPVITVCFKLLTDRLSLQAISRFLCDYKFLLLYLLSFVISLPLSVSPLFSLQRYLYTLLGFSSLFCLMIQYKAGMVEGYKTACYLFITAVFMALIIILASSPYVQLRYAVQNAGLVHPNMLSSLSAQLLLITLLLPAPHILKFILCTGLTLCILMLQSRGVWLSTSLALVIVLLTQFVFYQSKAALSGLLVCAIAVICLILALLIQPALLNDLLALFSRGASIEDLLSLTNRLDLWAMLFADIHLKEWLVGQGYALMLSDIGADFGDGILYGAHNGYLSIFLGAGLLPFLLWSFYWFYHCMALIRNRYSSALLVLCLSSLSLMLTHALVAEEFGMHLTPTLTLVLLNFHFTQVQA